MISGGRPLARIRMTISQRPAMIQQSYHHDTYHCQAPVSLSTQHHVHADRWLVTGKDALGSSLSPVPARRWRPGRAHRNPSMPLHSSLQIWAVLYSVTESGPSEWRLLRIFKCCMPSNQVNSSIYEKDVLQSDPSNDFQRNTQSLMLQKEQCQKGGSPDCDVVPVPPAPHQDTCQHDLG